MNGDYLIRATAADEKVRAFAIRSTEMAATARETHRTLPVVTAALGKLLSAGAMMGSMMKGENDKLTLQMKGDGPIGMLTVTRINARPLRMPSICTRRYSLLLLQ